MAYRDILQRRQTRHEVTDRQKPFVGNSADHQDQEIQAQGIPAKNKIDFRDQADSAQEIPGASNTDLQDQEGQAQVLRLLSTPVVGPSMALSVRL